MKMSKVGNQTNSQDPQAVNSRVFVGNLNTFQCSKTDVERMFQRYGRLAGISMHKGYAFVQFTNPFDARSACLGENGRTVLSQVLDVNMVAEPKPHQIGRKLQNSAKNGNDWDYYYDSYYASTPFPAAPARLAPPLKRPRLNSISSRSNKISTTQKTANISVNCDQIKIYSNPDILICGNCREMFTNLQDLLEHKKTYCKLRFTCKCHILPDNPDGSNNGASHSTATLLCVQCKDSFHNAWDLMVHAQAAHTLNIYTLGVANSDISEITTNGNNDDNNTMMKMETNGTTNGDDDEEEEEEDNDNELNTNEDCDDNGVGLNTNGDIEENGVIALNTNGVCGKSNGKSISSCGSLLDSPRSNSPDDKANGITNSLESSITNSYDTDFDTTVKH